MSKKLQKTVSILTSVMTILWLSGVAVLAPVHMAKAVTLVDGDLIRNPNAAGMAQFDIYIVKIVGAEKYKRLILSPHVFESYAHFDKNSNGNPWDDVVTVDQTTLDAYTTSDLVREINDTKVYKLVADGDTGSKQWLNMTAADFETQGYKWNSIYIINSTDRDAYTTGSDITTGTTTTTSQGTLAVALAADTPAAAVVTGGAARFPFTKVNLTASGGDVVIDTMTIQRGGGAAQDGSISSVAIIQDTTDGSQLGTNKTFNATHQTVVNDDLTIKSGETKSIYLAANMVSRTTIASYAGETPNLGLVAMTLKGTATLNATLPIYGNVMTINSTVTIGTAPVADGNNVVSASTQKVGVTNYIVTSLKITAGSAEDITVRRIKFTQDGSAAASDVKNLKLVNANTGETVASIEQPTEKTIEFTPSLVIGKGKNVSFDLKLDIVSGSARTISFDIDQDTDILVSGNTYGYYITPTYTLGGVAQTSRPYYNPADTTIGDGTLSIESMSVTPTNIAENRAGVLLGKFKFIDKGEEVKITSIGWSVKITRGGSHTASTTDITNLTVYDPSNVVIAGPADPVSAGNPRLGAGTIDRGTATTTDTIVVPVGETVYTVKGDLSADYTANDTVQIQVLPSIITARGMTTDNTITPTPASWIASTALTVKAAALAVSIASDPAAQTVVAGTQDFTFCKIVLDATNSGSLVKVTQVAMVIHTASTAYPDMISGIELFDGANKVSVNSDSTAYTTLGTTAGGGATTTLILSQGALTIPAGTSKVIVVKADVGTGTTGGSLKIGVEANSITATDEDGTSITETTTNGDGQTMSLSAGGTLNIAALTDPSSALVIAGTTNTVGKFSLQAKYEDINITNIGLTLANPDGGMQANEYDQVASYTLYEDGVSTAIGTANIGSTAYATITPASTLTIPAGTTKNYSLKATFAALNDTSPASSGYGVKTTITGIEATGGSAGSSSITKSGLDANFSSFHLFKSLPTFAAIPFSGADTITGNSEVSLYKFKITADSAGPIGLYKFSFGITTTTVKLAVFYDTSGFIVYMSDSEGSLGSIVSQGASHDANTTRYRDDMNAQRAGSSGSDLLLETFFDENNDETATASDQIIVNAGATKYFTLRGTISTGHDSTADNEQIATVFAGDASFASTGTTRKSATVADSGDQNDFIWSDLNADLYSSSTAIEYGMYFNGFRVPGTVTTSSTAQTVTD